RGLAFGPSRQRPHQLVEHEQGRVGHLGFKRNNCRKQNVVSSHQSRRGSGSENLSRPRDWGLSRIRYPTCMRSATSSLCRCVSVLANTDFNWLRAVSREIFNSRAAMAGGAPRAMMQASLASEGVRQNVFARIVAGGPGLGPRAFNVRRACTSWPGCDGLSNGQIRTMTGNLSSRGTMTGSKATE